MSQQTYVWMFAEELERPPAKVFHDLSRRLRVDRFRSASGMNHMDRAWERFLILWRDQEPHDDGGPLDEIHDQQADYLKGPLSIEDVAGYIGRYGTVGAAAVTPVVEELAEAIHREVPAKVLGNCRMMDLRIEIGPHDACIDDFQFPYYFGLSQLSVVIGLHAVPDDGQEFERLIYRVSKVRELERSVRAICGPTLRMVSWSV
ncbi:MAG: hypothetical protein FJ255_09445 [Phycisphaerae bacterium]|nr:hypothetical protein [Phycisphaerae bacterium]